MSFARGKEIRSFANSHHLVVDCEYNSQRIPVFGAVLWGAGGGAAVSPTSGSVVGRGGGVKLRK
jgi:hypothetical protein